MVATGGDDSMATLWTPPNAEPIFRLPHADPVKALAFNADATMLISATREDKVRLWNPRTGEPLSPEIACPAPIGRVLFIPESNSFAAIVNNGKSYVWTIPPDARSNEDLTSTMHLLANDWPLEMGTSNTKIRNAWDHLSKAYPANFCTSRERTLQWHEEQLSHAREHNDSLAIQLHTRAVAKLQGNESANSEQRSKGRD
jgi:WD40 repeat protein